MPRSYSSKDFRHVSGSRSGVVSAGRRPKLLTFHSIGYTATPEATRTPNPKHPTLATLSKSPPHPNPKAQVHAARTHTYTHTHTLSLSLSHSKCKGLNGLESFKVLQHLGFRSYLNLLGKLKRCQTPSATTFPPEDVSARFCCLTVKRRRILVWFSAARNRLRMAPAGGGA